MSLTDSQHRTSTARGLPLAAWVLGLALVAWAFALFAPTVESNLRRHDLWLASLLAIGLLAIFCAASIWFVHCVKQPLLELGRAANDVVGGRFGARVPLGH